MNEKLGPWENAVTRIGFRDRAEIYDGSGFGDAQRLVPCRWVACDAKGLVKSHPLIATGGIIRLSLIKVCIYMQDVGLKVGSAMTVMNSAPAEPQIQVWQNCRVASMAAGAAMIENANIIVRGEKMVYVGPGEDLRRKSDTALATHVAAGWLRPPSSPFWPDRVGMSRGGYGKCGLRAGHPQGNRDHRARHVGGTRNLELHVAGGTRLSHRLQPSSQTHLQGHSP